MKKQILFLSLTLCLMFSLQIIASATESNSFMDVEEKNWFYSDVQFVYENHLMSGIGDGKFAPSGTTTRGMVVTVLYRLAGSPAVDEGCSFDDVKSGSYYEKAVVWATKNAITNGYSNGNFGPNDDITREQLATILMRFANNMGYETGINSVSLKSISDYSQISSYAKEAMTWAYGKGIITGTSTVTLSPKSFATRAQIAAVLRRFCNETNALQATAEKVSVSYCLNYDNAPTISPTIVEKGKTIVCPEKPQRNGYTFLGWFMQEELTTLFDFSKPVEENIMIYAAWGKTGANKGDSNSEMADKETDSTSNNQDNVFVIASTLSEDGEMVEITLSLSGKVMLCGFDMQLLYDKEILSLVSLDDNIDLQLFTSGSEDTGAISFNYSNAKNISTGKTLLKAGFTVKNHNVKSTSLILQPVEVILTDESMNIISAPYSVSNAAIRLQ